jgi:hypothetical protein
MMAAIAFHQLLIGVAFVEVIWAGNVHVIETGNISVSSEVLQELDFAQGTLGQDLLAEDIGDLLDGHALAGLVVGGSADNAVCTLSQLLGYVVALVDDEFLVEHLEHLPPCEVGHGGRLRG